MRYIYLGAHGGSRTAPLVCEPAIFGPERYVLFSNGDIRLLGVAAYAAPVLSTLILVAAGFAPATSSLALACAMIVAGALVASFGAGRARGAA